MSVSFIKGNGHTSAVPINKDPELLELHNLQLVGSRNAWSGTREAFILTTAKDSPKDCRLVFNVDWIFINQDVDDNVTATLETTYFNGTTYRKILMPLQFLLRTDAGNIFETARVIMPGYYQGHLWLWDDSEDYYTIFLEKDQTINLQATAKFPLSFDLYVYDPDKNLLANSSINSN